MKSTNTTVTLHPLVGLLVVLLVLAIPPAQAQEGDAPELGGGSFNKGGRTAYQFLKIGVGARQSALGDAGMALVRDVNSVFWNPAGISGIETSEVSFSYVRWLADMDYVAGAAGYRWQGVGTLALSVAALNYGDIQESFVRLEGQNDTRTGNTVTGSDLQVGLTFARMFTSRLSIGVGVKYLRESLWEYAESSYAFDIGTNYDIGFNGTRLAMSVQNYSPASSKWLPDSLGGVRSEGYDIPLVFRVGVSTTLLGSQDAFMQVGPTHQLVLMAEALNSNDYAERLHVGAEYQFANFLSLRGGYRMNYAEGNWALGFGLHPELAGIDVRIDYAYAFYEFLTAPHRLTMSLAF